MSKATACSFVMERVSMLTEFLLLKLPVFALIVKVIEWSGSYLVLVLFCATTFVELVIIWLYPKVIAPLTASYTALPDKYAQLKEKMQILC